MIQMSTLLHLPQWLLRSGVFIKPLPIPIPIKNYRMSHRDGWIIERIENKDEKEFITHHQEN